MDGTIQGSTPGCPEQGISRTYRCAVRGADGETEFGLFAERHCLIKWGRAPGTDLPGELSVADKVRKFERYLREGNPVSNRIIDIRFPGRAVATRRRGTDGDNG